MNTEKSLVQATVLFSLSQIPDKVLVILTPLLGPISSRFYIESRLVPYNYSNNEWSGGDTKRP